MFLFRRPTSLLLDQILERARQLPLSYERPGLAAEKAPQDYLVGEEHAVIGQGAEVFARAAQGLREWRHFELGWARIYPRDAMLTPGSNVLVVAQHFGLWSVNACRVVYLLGDGGRLGPGSEVEGPGSEVEGSGSEVEGSGSEVAKAGSEVDTQKGRRPTVAGFAYGTLAEHAETGEEIFQVSIDAVTDEVSYVIRAVSRERALLAHLGFPIARALQARFRRDSVAAMRRWIADPAK